MRVRLLTGTRCMQLDYRAVRRLEAWQGVEEMLLGCLQVLEGSGMGWVTGGCGAGKERKGKVQCACQR